MANDLLLTLLVYALLDVAAEVDGGMNILFIFTFLLALQISSLGISANNAFQLESRGTIITGDSQGNYCSLLGYVPLSGGLHYTEHNFASDSLPRFKIGSTVTVVCEPTLGYQFSHWESHPIAVEFADATALETTFIVPEPGVEYLRINANFVLAEAHMTYNNNNLSIITVIIRSVIFGVAGITCIGSIWIIIRKKN